MRVAGFMSGSGTNLVKILEWQAEQDREPAGSPFRVAVIFTDNPESNAARIGEENGVPVVVEVDSRCMGLDVQGMHPQSPMIACSSSVMSCWLTILLTFTGAWYRFLDRVLAHLKLVLSVL